MTSLFRSAAIVAAIFTLGISAAFAQKPKPKVPVSKTPDYTIGAISVNAFNNSTNELSDAIPETGEPLSFFNDLDTSLFVWVLIQGEAGTFEAGRMANVVVTEGKKVILTRNVQIGIPNEQGFYTVPVYVYGPLCSQVKISAKITGQKGSQPRAFRCRSSAVNRTFGYQVTKKDANRNFEFRFASSLLYVGI